MNVFLKNKILLLIIFIVFSFFAFLGIKAGLDEHNVSGWAWSENIGWISFNSTTGGGSTNYGVNIDDSTGIFSGYAWSENIGWITFNSAELSGCPASPRCPSGICRAEFNSSTNEVCGWARVLNAQDGWDGWISLRGTAQDSSPYEVSYNDLSDELKGWAWSGDIGWISFNNCSDEGGCGGSDYHVDYTAPPLVNEPPVCTVFDVIPGNGASPLDVAFTAQGIDDGLISSYEFDFGDGPPTPDVSGPSNTANNTYNSEGVYCSKARVQDDNGTWSADAWNCSTYPTSTYDVYLQPPDNADSDFGSRMSVEGDINNDGFPDIIVAAHMSNRKCSLCGAVYIYYGSDSMLPTVTPDVYLEYPGTDTGARFGSSISSGGDVNGDNIDDIVIGAYDSNFQAQNDGAAFIYYGRDEEGPSPFPSFPNLVSPDVFLQSAQSTGDFFSSSLSSAGDIDGDGLNDIVIGAQMYGSFLNWTGAAFVYYGSNSFSSYPTLVDYDVHLEYPYDGEWSSPDFGLLTTFAGDVNNDGHDDVLVGARYSDPQCNNCGSAHIFFGDERALMNGIADVSLLDPSPENGSSFGYSGSSAGDFNGDAFDDVVVGAYNVGEAFVYFGAAGTTMDGNYDVSLEYPGIGADSDFGFSFSSGDIDRDGFIDIAVSARTADIKCTDCGAAFVYYGSSTLAVPATIGYDVYFEYTGTDGDSGGNFGRDISIESDINKDGYPDVVLGAFNSDFECTHCGAVYLHYTPSPCFQEITVTGVINQPPAKPSGTSEVVKSCSGGAPQVNDYTTVTLNWSYSHPQGDSQDAYEIWLDDDDDNFSGSMFNLLVGNDSEAYTINLNDDDDEPNDWLSALVWGNAYEWKVRVKDNQGNQSEWSDPKVFTMNAHANPYPNFQPFPQNPSVDELVEFIQDDPGVAQALCYGGGEHACEGDVNVAYEWDFDYNPGDILFDDTFKGNATTTYSDGNSYTIRLQITDLILSDSCHTDKTINLSEPLPEWSEVMP